MTRSLRNLLYALLASGAFIAFVCLLGPWWSVYEFGSDEGLNLQKAVLVDQGYRLYAEIWSDQPPVLTWILVAVHDIFPFSVAASRATILAFSALLLVSQFRVVNRFSGLFAAVVATVLLATSKLYLLLSVSVMIGLPAVALAVFALDLATSGSGRNRIVFAGFAGAVFCAAFLTKMFVVLALPALLVAFWHAGSGSFKASKKAGATIFAGFVGGFFLSGAAAFFVLADVPIDQLLAPHLDARTASGYVDAGGLGHLIGGLSSKSTLAFYFTCIFGLATFAKRPAGPLLIPAIWLAAGVAVLASHRPLWDHQLLILLPPLCWLGGAGFHALFRRQDRFGLVNQIFDSRIGGKAVWIGVSILLLAGAFETIEKLDDVKTTFSAPPKLVEEMASLRLQLLEGEEGTVVTDKPIDAYYLRKSVPPSLAVWSHKRAVTGNISETEVLRETALRPRSQVLLRRFDHEEETLAGIARLVPPVAPVMDRYANTGIHHFAPAAEEAAEAGFILAALPRIAGETLGGVDGPGSNMRLERPQSRRPLPPGSIVARPPGSAQELGACLVAASRAFGSKALLLEAVGVGAALSCTQTPQGGWEKAALPSASCGGVGFVENADTDETFDDATIPSIVYFAFSLSDRLREFSVQPPHWLELMIERALGFVVQAQLENGGWPQSIESTAYHPLATLNDDVSTGLIRILVFAHDRTGDPTYLAAAQLGGEFLLNAQGTGDQAAFAQQYGASIQPESARAFEPVAYASLETAYAINALVDLYLVTRDERFRQAAKAAGGWLLSSHLDGDKWARFYEVGTNRPLFATRSGETFYRLEDLPVSERISYRWIGDREVFPDIAVALERLEMLDQGPDFLREYDRKTAGSALLANTPTARLPLDRAVASADFVDAGSTRLFAQYCAGIVAERDRRIAN